MVVVLQCEERGKWWGSDGGRERGESRGGGSVMRGEVVVVI